MSRAPLLACALALLAIVLAPAPRAEACCPAHPPGARVQIADQEIVIVWDAAKKMEHFIRRASFATSQAAFGFLVPTPSVPALAEAPDLVFDRFAHAIEPVVKPVARLRLGSLFFMYGAARDAGMVKAAPTAVRVLASQRVAGYDAVVLEADDPHALAEWLARNGYESRPALVEWLRPYVEARWKITAFKLAAQDDGSLPRGPGETRYAVRMSFATERPVFPYRTPSDQHDASSGGVGDGLLRIFFVGDAKMAGSLGKEPWGARVAYASGRRDLHMLLEGALPEGEAPRWGWLTAFEEPRWPRAAAEDLTFAPAPDSAQVLPPPILVDRDVVFPVEFLIFGVVSSVILLRVIKRRRDGQSV